MENKSDLQEALEAYLMENEPTAIMSVQTLREKLAESMIPDPPDTVPACPFAIRKHNQSKPTSGTRPRLTLGSYLKVNLRRRAR